LHCAAAVSIKSTFLFYFIDAFSTWDGGGFGFFVTDATHLNAEVVLYGATLPIFSFLSRDKELSQISRAFAL